MNLITFINEYLQDNVPITIVENDIDIIFEGTANDLENPIIPLITLDDIATRNIDRIEGIGSNQDIIVYLA